jgi:CubicO group peptidase (beta-lactamase class C family)
MRHAEFIKGYEEGLKQLPDQTQIAIALIENGRTSYYGLIKNENAIQPIDNAASLFEIGSVTKAFTGNILAQLVLDGKVGLDDPIQPFLPFQLLDNPPITIKQLAQHTSGLPKLPHDFKDQLNYQSENPYLNYTEKLLVRYFTANLRLDSSPGDRYQYSNLGMSLLSFIISKIEEKPFPDIVSERIFKPLNMDHSTFDHQTIRTTFVRGIGENDKFCGPWACGIYSGSIGIISAAKDLASFAILQSDASNAACKLQSQETFLAEPLFKSNLGWGERLVVPENISIRGINGGTGGYGASVMLNLKTNSAIVILTNIFPKHYIEVISPINKALLLRL